MSQLTPPPLRAPAIQLRSPRGDTIGEGYFHAGEWTRFMLSLFNRAGGVEAPSLSEVEAQLEGILAQLTVVTTDIDVIQAELLTVPTLANVLAAIATVAMTLSNKVLDVSNSATFLDTLFTVQDDSDATKQLQWELSGLPPGTLAQLSVPSFTVDTVVLANAAQLLYQKSLISPFIATPTGLTKADVGLGNVDNTSDATKNSAPSTLTNKRTVPRVVALTPGVTSYTPTGDTADVNTFSTNLASGTLTANAPTGTPTDRQLLMLAVMCTNSQTLAWNGIYRSTTTLTLPTSHTGGGKEDRYGFQYMAGASKWDLIAYARG